MDKISPCVATDEETKCLLVNVASNSSGLFPSSLINIIVVRVTSSLKTHLDTALDGVISRITSLKSKCDSVVELLQGVNKTFDGRGIGIADFERNKGVDEMQEQNVAILGDEVIFETGSQICAKLHTREIDLSTPPEKIDDLLSRKRKWCEVSDVDDCPSFALITPTSPNVSDHMSVNDEFCAAEDLGNS